MSLTVTRAEIVSFPGAEAGNSQSVDVAFRLYTNVAAPGNMVIKAAIAQGKLPQPDEYLGQTVAIKADGETYVDTTVQANRYRHQNLFESERSRTRHMVTVTYEEPEEGGATFIEDRRDPYVNDDPLARPIEKTVEYQVESVPVLQAENVEAVGNREPGTVGPITNTAGFQVPEQYMTSERTPILVLRKWVSSWETSIDINTKFENTYNHEKWSRIEKRRAKFLSAEMAGPEWWKGLPRYQLTVKVAKGALPWYINVPNVGDKYYAVNASGVEQAVKATDLEGFPCGPVSLDASGKPTWDVGKVKMDLPITLAYTVLKDADYTELESMIANYK